MINATLKITILSENTVGGTQGLIGEWGLSMLVEAAGRRILFDTGERGSMVSNASALGLDLNLVDALVLSHGHYDHTGGMQSLLRLRGKTKVYAHSKVFAGHYSSPEQPRYIGVPFTRGELESIGAEFIFLNEPLEIYPGIWISGEIPRVTDYEKVESRLFSVDVDGNKKIIPDPFYDDMSLFCVIHDSLIIVLGCAHAGLVNIVEYARNVTGINKVYGIIGGTHLGPASEQQQEAAIAFLQSLDLQFLAANHCTGLPMITRLAGIFSNCFYFAPTGASFIF
jgi:7,8-dihydropterin-6-yl-methyl-4-(beta-D-ribofuranosyl)aminobenzene 5'-phosphate synthase